MTQSIPSLFSYDESTLITDPRNFVCALYNEFVEISKINIMVNKDKISLLSYYYFIIISLLRSNQLLEIIICLDLKSMIKSQCVEFQHCKYENCLFIIIGTR